MENRDTILQKFENGIGHELCSSRKYKFEDYAYWVIDKLAETLNKVNGAESESKPALHKQSVNGWHLFSEQKPTEGDNIEVYYKNNIGIVNVDWQDYLYEDKEFEDMVFWRACR